jgi:hypothetical protein
MTEPQKGKRRPRGLQNTTSAVLVALSLIAPGAAMAQSWQTRSATLALKSGETAEIGDLYFVINCRSILKGPPQATILSGPPGVTVEVKEADVLPRIQQCSRPVKGGKLIIKAGDVGDESETTMTIRVNFDTKDGPRQVGYNVNLSLFPAQ